jgi:hypothetical protein
MAKPKEDSTGLGPYEVDPCDVGHGVCGERYTACRNGEMEWLEELGGWVLHTAPTREPEGWRARYYTGWDTTGAPYLWADCPFCGGLLPDLRRKSNVSISLEDMG